MNLKYPIISAFWLATLTGLFAQDAAPLFNGRNLEGWMDLPKAASDGPGWAVKDGAMASLGAGRGIIYTAKDYSHYRLTFQMRHVGAATPKQDHPAALLIFCVRPEVGQPALDALGRIQFQVPNGGHWDYRPGHNNNGTDFHRPAQTHYDDHAWSQVEIVVNAATGVARMAVANPVGSRAVENLDFSNPAAGRVGPIALQMHNAGLFDEFRDLKIEVDPKTDDLLSIHPLSEPSAPTPRP